MGREKIMPAWPKVGGRVVVSSSGYGRNNHVEVITRMTDKSVWTRDPEKKYGETRWVPTFSVDDALERYGDGQKMFSYAFAYDAEGERGRQMIQAQARRNFKRELGEAFHQWDKDPNVSNSAHVRQLMATWEIKYAGASDEK
jgi:hypothetical protein